MRKCLPILVLLLLFSLPGAALAGDGLIHKAPGPDMVKDSYIVTFQPGYEPAQVARAAQELARTYRGEIRHIYRHLGKAAFRMSEARAQAMAHHPKVARVSRDAKMRLSAVQTNPPWGLDRIDQWNLPLDDLYTYNSCNSGSGVTVFVLDTGIRTTHVDFGGRAFHGVNCSNDQENDTDTFGHGTRVAGVIGGATYGVAKDVGLVSVKVCKDNVDCDESDILCGIEYVIAEKSVGPNIPMIANMSLGQGVGVADLNEDVARLVNAGVFVVVSAGNDNADADNFSPSSEESAYTVAAVDSNDVRWHASNYGEKVDIFAPGGSIPTADCIVIVDGKPFCISDTGTTTVNGTSMAAPHVAGAAALIMERNPDWPRNKVVENVTDELNSRAVKDVLTDIGPGSENLLLNMTEFLAFGTYRSDNTSSDHNFNSRSFSVPSPIVVAGPPNYSDADPTTIRVQNISSVGFEHRLEEWSYQDGNHAFEHFSFLAVTEGPRKIGGLETDSGTVDARQYWAPVSFEQCFSEPPVVVAQVATVNDSEPVTTRIRNVTATGFEIRLQEEEAADGVHALETVHWIAMEVGYTEFDGTKLTVGYVDAPVTDAFTTVDLSSGFTGSLRTEADAVEPKNLSKMLLADMQTFVGGDPATLRIRNLTPTGFEIRVQEETSADSETAHLGETVGYILMIVGGS